MSRPSVVIVGGGFGGLACAQSLRRTEVDITLIDRRNFHLFQPLLYQVATGGLSPANIASPLRCILRKQQNAKVVMDEVKGFDFASRTVLLDHSNPIPFDYLVVATGSTHHYFGKDEQYKDHAPGLKTIEDATHIRKRILSAFEEAERCQDPIRQRQCLTFVIVGGGPTGIELAGAICELSRQTMRREFRSIDPATARVILVENSPVILERYHASLSQKAKEALLSLGAEIWNESKVTNLDEGWVEITRQGSVEKVLACTVLWAAGVKASPLGAIMAQSAPGLELDRAGRILVDPFCNIPSDHQIFVIGDMAHQKGSDGNPLPGVAPVAIQQGEYVGKSISRRVTGFSDRDPFQYWDKGNMATIGRSRAVMESGKLRASGKIAWLAWLFIHIMYLARFENRVMVLFQWAWNYITRNRTARLITDGPKRLLDEPAVAPISTDSPSRSLS